MFNSDWAGNKLTGSLRRLPRTWQTITLPKGLVHYQAGEGLVRAFIEPGKSGGWTWRLYVGSEYVPVADNEFGIACPTASAALRCVQREARNRSVGARFV